MLSNCQQTTFIILTSTFLYVPVLNEPQYPNFLYGFYSPAQHNGNREYSHLNRYSPKHAIKPSTYNIGYYATIPQHAVSPAIRYLPTTATTTTTAAYEKYGSLHGPEYTTPTFRQLNQLPQHNQQQQQEEQQQQQQQQQQHLNYQQHNEVDQRRRAAPKIVQQHRNEGNFYRQLEGSTTATVQRKHELEQQKDQKLQQEKPKYISPNSGFAVFEHKVLHVTTTPTPPTTTFHHQDFRKRRSSLTITQNKTTKAPPPPPPTTTTTSDHKNGKNMRRRKEASKSSIDSSTGSSTIAETERPHQQEKLQYFHDIFMHFAGPQSIAYGHVDSQPQHFAQRFESVNRGNRFRGEVTWADMKTGGYGSQHWDLVQGKL